MDLASHFSSLPLPFCCPLPRITLQLDQLSMLAAQQLTMRGPVRPMGASVIGGSAATDAAAAAGAAGVEDRRFAAMAAADAGTGSALGLPGAFGASGGASLAGAGPSGSLPDAMMGSGGPRALQMRRGGANPLLMPGNMEALMQNGQGGRLGAGASMSGPPVDEAVGEVDVEPGLAGDLAFRHGMPHSDAADGLARLVGAGAGGMAGGLSMGAFFGGSGGRGGLSDDERSLVLELATRAVEEVVKMAQIDEPLWEVDRAARAGSGFRFGDVLNREEYQRFPNYIGNGPPELTVEATRAAGIVALNALAIVEIFLDPVRAAPEHAVVLCDTGTVTCEC